MEQRSIPGLVQENRIIEGSVLGSRRESGGRRKTPSQVPHREAPRHGSHEDPSGFPPVCLRVGPTTGLPMAVELQSKLRQRVCVSQHHLRRKEPLHEVLRGNLRPIRVAV